MSTSKNRRLAAILFADIVGYTALMQRDEITANQNLEKFHQTLNEKVNQYKGQVINNYGDGCVCTFDSAVDAMHCANDIQRVFQQAQKVPVRIGLHSGDVYFKDDNVYGDSVNIASRIESLGVASAILFSKRIKRDIANQTAFKVQSLGEFHFKNVDKAMEVFALANEGFVIPKRTEMKGKLAPFSTKNKRAILAVILVGLLGMAAFWFGTTKQSTNYTSDDKSIAVLPFKDMSPQQDQEYFSDGVAEEILNALSKLEDLKVAGRISSFSFKDKKDIAVSEIGQQLNVSTILNGSIRKSGNQIRVTANLVNTADGFQIWSEVYDEELKDIFSVQERIAQNIVQKFQLSQSLENEPLFAQQTSNLEAYEQYLKGRFYAAKSIDGIQDAQQAFENAIQLDSNYALAYDGLGEVYWFHTVYGLSNRVEAFKNMKMALEKAIEIAPQTASSYTGLGYYYSLFKLDWSTGMDYMKKGAALDFREKQGLFTLQLLYNPTKENLEKAVQLNEEIVAKDPLSINARLNLNRTYIFAEKFEKVIGNAKEVFELNPTQRSNMRHISEAYLFTGQPEKAIVYTEQLIQKNNYAYYDYILNLVLLDRMEEAKIKFNEQIDSLDAFTKAYCFFALNEPNKGFEYLELARLENNPLIFFHRFWPPISVYEKDPRYIAFKAKLNLPHSIKD